MSATLLTAFALIFSTFTLRYAWSWVKRRAINPVGLPPGPKPYPLLGNVLEMPASYIWLKYAEWSKVYGDVFHLVAFGQHYIILNSHQACSDLFESRSMIYSDKPHSTMLCDLWVQSCNHSHPSWFEVPIPPEWIFRGSPQLCRMDLSGGNTANFFTSTSARMSLRATPQSSWLKHARCCVDSLIIPRSLGSTFDCQ